MKKGLKVFLIVLAVILVLVGTVLIVVTRDYADPVMNIPKEDVDGTRNPYIVPTGETMVSAHRSGGGIAPENTLMAFQNCVESGKFSIDIFEFDLHLTKDDQLVLLHDKTLDRTSDAVELFGHEEVYPHDYTYEELLKLNMGEGFETDDGKTPYKGLRGADVPENLRIMRLQDVFDYLAPFGEHHFIIEIKDGKEIGKKATDKLYETLQANNLLQNVVVGTFHGEISQYMDDTYPDMLRSAGIKEVVNFYFSSLCGIKHAPDYYKFKALQIPANQFVIHLGTSRLCNYAHKYNIAVQYWTINDPKDVAMLASVGADAVMSDNPDMVYEVFCSKEK